MSISTYYYKVKISSDEDEIIKKEIEEIIETLPESGYRPVTCSLKGKDIISTTSGRTVL